MHYDSLWPGKLFQGFRCAEKVEKGWSTKSKTKKTNKKKFGQNQTLTKKDNEHPQV